MSETKANAQNPLIEKFETPHSSPPFDKIKHGHYLPAIRYAIKEAKKEINEISTRSEKPDFFNTIEALSYSGDRLGVISGILFNLNHAETNETLQNITKEISPELTDFYNDILFDQNLYKKVSEIFENREQSDLNAEQLMLLEKTYKSFQRNGAGLDDEKKEKLRKISRELSKLSLQFSDNVLAETNGWHLHVTDENELAGLPESALDDASQTARSKNLEGWVFTLQATSFIPFMRYAENRELRKKMYLMYSRRGYQDNDRNNAEIIKRIAGLRLEKANLLGFETWAEFSLQETMAQNSLKVMDFLKTLADAAYLPAQKEVKMVQEFAQSKGFNESIEPWDWAFWSEKLRKEKFNFDEELTRPYFELDSVIDGVFTLVNKLYDLSFKQVKNIPVYHPDVKVYEVFDEHGSLRSLLYLDFFPREGKSAGAWMTTYRNQYRKNGEKFIPHVSLVCNFSKPTNTKPSLLTHNEVNTFLHEFGHGLHGMLSDVTYPDLAGTNVYHDFVELPSQIMENWAVEKEFLNMFAKHYKTGEPMPDEMIRKIIDNKQYLAAYATVRQLSFGFNDMAWHTITSEINIPVESFETKAMEPVKLFPRIEGTMMSTAFSHIFAGGYAAGYYGYKWAEVLDADAFELFKENGIFDKETAQSFKENILTKGGSRHPMELFVNFRKREPSVDAMLKRDGLKN